MGSGPTLSVVGHRLGVQRDRNQKKKIRPVWNPGRYFVFHEVYGNCSHEVGLAQVLLVTESQYNLGRVVFIISLPLQNIDAVKPSGIRAKCNCNLPTAIHREGE